MEKKIPHHRRGTEMIDWKFANKLRPHNRKETTKHFMAKAMAFKILFNAGYYVYSEYDLWQEKKLAKNTKEFNKSYRVADVYADGGLPWFKTQVKPIVVEIESKITMKHKIDLMNFYEDRTLYIIDLRKISDDINKMEKQIRHILGM